MCVCSSEENNKIADKMNQEWMQSRLKKMRCSQCRIQHLRCTSHTKLDDSHMPQQAGERDVGDNMKWTWIWEDRDMVKQWVGFRKRGATDDNPAHPTSRPLPI